MKSSITQLHPFGCGVACLAFILDKTYQEMAALLGEDKATSQGFICKELVFWLEQFGLAYNYQHLNLKNRKIIYRDNVIVFIRRSKKYPVGHFLVRYKRLWMDPWINFLQDQNILSAKSGYRKKLPGRPIFANIPI